MEQLHSAAALSWKANPSLCRRASHKPRVHWNCTQTLSLQTHSTGVRGRAGSPQGKKTHTEAHIECPDQYVWGMGIYQLPEEVTSVLSTYGKLAWREQNPRGSWEFSNVWEIAAGKWKVFVKEIRGPEAEIPLVMALTEERNCLAVLWKGASRGQDSKRKWSWVIAAPHKCWQLGENPIFAGPVGNISVWGAPKSKLEKSGD